MDHDKELREAMEKAFGPARLTIKENALATLLLTLAGLLVVGVVAFVILL